MFFFAKSDSLRQAAVRIGYKQNLHALLCLAENAVGPLATRPDDVHTLLSGKTVEVVDFFCFRK